MDIERTACLKRIVALPRREPVPPPGLVEQLTSLLKTPKGAQTLFPLQALALHDIGTCSGAFLPLDLGEGKTLISLLAAYVLDAKRPLLLLPANLIAKTIKEAREFSKHWRIPSNIRLMSYQMLGLKQSARELEVYQPDLIIADEGDNLKNRDAARTRRVERYLTVHPEVPYVDMTGTIMSKSIRDFAHRLRWALKDGAPVPLKDSEVNEWALALDESIENEFQRMGPGALLELATSEEIAELGPVAAVRRGFKRRLRETPGVVCSAETGAEVGVGLTVRAIRYDVSPEMEEHFEVLRNDSMTPNGEVLWEKADVWRHAREMALGFYQRWTPPAPDDWKKARKEWFQFVRGVISRSHTWDSPDHVAEGCDAGKLDPSKLMAWRRIQKSFTPNPVPYWVDDCAIKVITKWMGKGPGIVWVKHVPLGQRLAQLTGAKYYSADGCAPDGEAIEKANPESVIIASVDANRAGRNLQAFWRNLITTLEGPAFVHQLIGRTHRKKQTRDVVVDILLGCSEHADAFRKARAGAYAIRETVGSQNKLLLASIEWPSDEEVGSWSGAQWAR